MTCVPVPRRDSTRKNSIPKESSRVNFDKIGDLARHLLKKITILLNKTQEINNNAENQEIRWLWEVRDYFTAILGINREVESIPNDEFADMVVQVFPILTYIAGLQQSLSTRKSAPENWHLIEPLIKVPALIADLPSEGDLHPILIALVEEFQMLPPPNPNVEENIVWDQVFSRFLAAYNSGQKTQRGVIYTPPALVRFLLNGVDAILREKFSFVDGILSSNVKVLDPAAGLLNFTCGYLENFFTGGAENPSILVEGAFVALEIMPVQVILGQVRFNQYIQHLNDQGIFVPKDFFVTAWRNALAEPPLDLFPLDGMTMPVVIGNPPYNVSSKNKAPWIQDLMEDYKKGLQRAGTKRISVSRLQDDYAKFYRLAQWVIEQAGHGLIAFITSRSFIDGLVHRGMRYSLASTFDEIYVIDLNGDSRDLLPAGVSGRIDEPDENIFPIQQGVAITFLAKYSTKPPVVDGLHCLVHYAGLVGSRASKLETLARGFSNLPFQVIPLDQDISFRPAIGAGDPHYTRLPYLLEIFQEHVQGIVSAHDSLVFDVDMNRLQAKIETFLCGGEIGALGATARDGRDWKIATAQTETTVEEALSHIIPCAYRGFDRRWLCYDLALINKGTNRFPLMQHLVAPGNIAIVTNRLSVTPMDVLAVDCVVDNGMVSGARASRSYIFPLLTGGVTASSAKSWNIRPEFLSRLPFPASPPQVFYYIYGILNTPAYALKYSREILKDFPRIPFPADYTLFQQVSQAGEVLANLHALKSDATKDIHWLVNIAAIDWRIHHPTYDASTGRIYFDKPISLNAEIFWVGNVSPAMWAFQIGGIFQLRQWLQVRKFSPLPKRNTLPRGLTPDEIQYFCHVCFVIQRTLELRVELDVLFTEIEAKILWKN